MSELIELIKEGYGSYDPDDADVFFLMNLPILAA